MVGAVARACLVGAAAWAGVVAVAARRALAAAPACLAVARVGVSAEASATAGLRLTGRASAFAILGSVKLVGRASKLFLALGVVSAGLAAWAAAGKSAGARLAAPVAVVGQAVLAAPRAERVCARQRPSADRPAFAFGQGAGVGSGVAGRVSASARPFAAGDAVVGLTRKAACGRGAGFAHVALVAA